MRRRKRNSMYFALLSLVLLISVGYALLSTDLKINGTSRIDTVTWDVHFENAQATDKSTVIPSIAPETPAESKLQQLNYDVTFDTPGQIYEFTVDVVNGGTIDAMIGEFTTKVKVGDGEEVVLNSSKSNLPSYLSYDVSYSDGITIANNHLLASGNREKIKVMVEYRRDITEEELNDASGKTITLNLSLNYKQSDTSIAEVRPVEKFVVSNSVITSGARIPDGVNTRNSKEDAINDWIPLINRTNPYFLRYFLNGNGIITESYVGFVISDELANDNAGVVAGTYYLKGGDDGLSYPENVKVLKKAFGYSTNANRCGGTEAENFHCQIGIGDAYLYVSTTSGGWVSANKPDSDCHVNGQGVSKCTVE